MARVFLIAKEVGSNAATYADAIKFGGLKFLLKQGEFVDFYNFDETIDFLEENLVKIFKPTEDFILLTGNVTVNSLCVSLLMKRFPHLNILVYDGKRDRYMHRILTEQHFKKGKLPENAQN